jgi:putative redox protein
MTISQKMVIDWQGNYRLVAKNKKGLTVSFDAPLLFGGEESALSPMENVLASLAACSSIHIISILKEKEQKVCGFSVEIQAEREQEPPKTFTKIHIKYIIKGTNLNRNFIKKAIEDSESNYWSVGTMLKKAVQITSTFEIVKE